MNFSVVECSREDGVGIQIVIELGLEETRVEPYTFEGVVAIFEKHGNFWEIFAGILVLVRVGHIGIIFTGGDGSEGIIVDIKDGVQEGKVRSNCFRDDERFSPNGVDIHHFLLLLLFLLIFLQFSITRSTTFKVFGSLWFLYSERYR